MTELPISPVIKCLDCGFGVELFQGAGPNPLEEHYMTCPNKKYKVLDQSHEKLIELLKRTELFLFLNKTTAPKVLLQDLKAVIDDAEALRKVL